MRNMKGFTLIELLAVIIILSIIVAITIPVASNIIKESRENASIDSAYGIKRALDEYYTSYGFSGNSFKGFECSFPSSCNDIELTGNIPSSGYVSIDKNGLINGKLSFYDEFYFVYKNDEIIQVSKEEFYFEDVNLLKEKLIDYANNGVSCSYDFYTGVNNCSGLNLDKLPIGGKIYISNGNINGVMNYKGGFSYEVVNNQFNLVDFNRDDFIVYLDFENGFNNSLSKWNISYNSSLDVPKSASINNSIKYGGYNSAYFEGVFDKYGNELYVDETSDFTVGNVYTFDLFYSPSINDTSTNYALLQKGYYVKDLNGGFIFRYDRQTNYIDFLITNSSSTVFELKYNKFLENNKWYRLTVTSDGSTIRMFVDGKLVASKSCNCSISALGEPFTIGGRTTGVYTTGASAGGYLDDVYINTTKCLYTNNF